MTIEELKKEYECKIDALNEEFNNKIAELQKAEKESNKKWWKPEDGENYFYINGTGEIQRTFYMNDYIHNYIGNKHYTFHNMFKTGEEVEFAAEFWKVIRELEMLSDDDKEWNESYSHYAIECDKASLCVTENILNKEHPFYFKSKESAQKAIEIIGEDRLKKFWFGIKDDEE